MLDPITVADDMFELGLVALCPAWIGREAKRRRCGLEVVSPGAFCTGHGGDQLSVQRTVVRQRKYLEDELLPIATQRILGILTDTDEDGNYTAKDTDVVRIWSTIMDRVGLAAMQNVNLQSEVSVAAPLEILRSMLMGQRAIESESPGEVVDGEVVE